MGMEPWPLILTLNPLRFNGLRTIEGGSVFIQWYRSVLMNGHGTLAKEFLPSTRHASMACGRLKEADN